MGLTGLRTTRTEDAADRPAVAYLVSQYPTLSHAFIEREVAAVRRAGRAVRTFSVRPTTAGDARSRAAREEAEATSVLLGRRPQEYLAAHARVLRRSPLGWARTAATALRTGPRGVKRRVWQLFYFTEAVALRSDLEGTGVRHVHVHFANNGADIARLAVALGRAVDGPDAGWTWTFSMHGPTEFGDPVGHDLAAKVRSADAVACISEFCRDELLATLPPAEVPGQSGKTAIVRMAVDAEHYAAGADTRAERDEDELRVLFVGRLVPEKDPTVLPRVSAALRARGVPVRFRVVGEGPLREELERAAATDDLVEVVGGVGQDDLPAQYAWADVFCLPSHAEGLPAVLMEAMATELPVVTTRIAGIPELVRDGENGRLVAPGDVDALADALADLAGDRELRRTWGRAGRDRVLEEFAPEGNAQRLLDLWDGTTGHEGPVDLTDPGTVDVRERSLT